MQILKLIFIFFLLNTAGIDVNAQKNINNYNSDKIINNDSCNYEQFSYQPDVFIDSLSDIVDESSGVIFYRGALWTHNDSGGEPKIYKIDTITGKVIQTITIRNAVNKDWEDIAQDSLFFYIGDFGNNHGNRRDLKIYKIAKNQIPEFSDDSINASIIYFSYKDQINYSNKLYRHNFDCEALFAYKDSLYLFSKDWADYKTRLYSLPKIPGKYKISPYETYNINGLVTGADINLSSNEITLIGYNDYVSFIFILSDFRGNDFFSGNKRRIDFPDLIYVQTEGITYTYGKNVLISCEKSSVPQRVYKVNTALFTSSYKKITKNIPDDFEVKIVHNGSKKRFSIYIDKIPYNNFILRLYNTHWFELFHKKYNFDNNFKKPIYVCTKKYKPGLYFLKIICRDKSIVKKVVINKQN